LGAEGLQENWDEHFDIIWIRCRTHMILEPGALVGESRRYFPTRLQTPIMSLDEESDLPRLIEDLTVEE
jgi:hypothetical protein